MKLYLTYIVPSLVMVNLIHQSCSSGQINGSELDSYVSNASITSCDSGPPWSVCKDTKCRCLKSNEVYMKCGKHKTHLQSCACLCFNQQFLVGKCLFSCHSNITQCFKIVSTALKTKFARNSTGLEICVEYAEMNIAL